MHRNRHWEPGTIHHVMGRGVRRTALFRDEEDYIVFYRILKQALKTCNCELYCYCLMTNHFHLLVKTNDISISSFMNRLMGNYARSFNQKYDYTGHVFESRYTSKLVNTDRYFLEVSRYIHLNPVKAGIVANAEDYLHSSYYYYVRNIPSSLVNTSRLKLYFPDNPIAQYVQYASNPQITWKSADTYIASVDQNTGKVTTNHVGKVKITAFSNDGSNKSKTVTVIVKPKKETITNTYAYDDHSIYASWESQYGVTGYQIIRSTTKNFESGTTKSYKTKDTYKF